MLADAIVGVGGGPCLRGGGVGSVGVAVVVLALLTVDAANCCFI